VIAEVNDQSGRTPTGTEPAAIAIARAVPVEDPLAGQREHQLERLTRLQDEVLSSAAEPLLIEKAVPRFLALAADVSAATDTAQLVQVGLRLEQVAAGWRQFQRLTRRRDRARLYAVVLVGLLFAFLAAATVYEEWFQLDITDEVRLLHVPVYILVWSTVGSLAAILYRFNRSATVELDDPMRVLLTRPLTGIILGAFSYLLVQLGFLAVSGGAGTAESLGGERGVHLMIVVAFVVSFSDRLSEAVLKALVGRFGGDKTGDLVDLPTTSSALGPAALVTALDAGGRPEVDFATPAAEDRAASIAAPFIAPTTGPGPSA
jgi:hypothetical protein